MLTGMRHKRSRISLLRCVNVKARFIIQTLKLKKLMNPSLNTKITRLYEELELSTHKEAYDRVMKELLEKGSEKSQLLKHVLNVFDTCTVQSASDVSARAITEFSNTQSCAPAIRGMDMVNSHMPYNEVALLSICEKRKELVDFSKEDPTIVKRFFDRSFDNFTDKIAYTDIWGSVEYTACSGNFFLEHVPEPLPVLNTMITHYQLAEVAGSITLSSHLFHIVSVPLFLTFCLPLLQQGNMVLCLKSVHTYCENFIVPSQNVSYSGNRTLTREEIARAWLIDRNPVRFEGAATPPIRNAGGSSDEPGIDIFYQRKPWLVGITSLGVGGYFFSQSFPLSWGLFYLL